MPAVSNLRTRRRTIIKNFVVLLLGVVPLFIAYATFFLLQSSMNNKDGLGTFSLAADYAAQVITCCFLPPLVIRKLGCKLTLTLSVMAFLPYYAANFYPRFSTLLPSAFLLGIAFGTIWSSFCTFTSAFAYSYAKVTDSDPERILGYFFGVGISSLKGASMVSGLGGYFLLSNYEISNNHKPPSYCGIEYCNEPLGFSFSNTSTLANSTSAPTILEDSLHGKTITIMCATFIGISVIGLFLVVCFLDDVPIVPQRARDSLSATVRLIIHSKYQQLLILPGIALGLLQSFYAAEFLKAFFTCNFGISYSNLSNIIYGASLLLGSLTVGFLSRFFRRYILLVSGFLFSYVYFGILLMWRPSRNDFLPLLAISALYGFTEAGCLTQLSALYGTIFPNDKEAAFTNSRLWECIGLAIGFGWSSSICIYIKVYILITTATLGIVCISLIEYLQWKEKQVEN